MGSHRSMMRMSTVLLTPRFLLMVDPENKKGELAACGDDRFCCAADFNSGKCDCSDRVGPFIISAGLPQTIIQVSDTTFTGSPSLSIASTRPSTTRLSITGTGTTATTTNDPSSTASLASGQTSSSDPTTAPAAPPVASSKGDDDSDSGSGMSTGLKIGLGVGIPVAVLAVAGALAYFLWWKPKQIERARRNSQLHHEYFQSMDLAENDPHGPAKYEPYRSAAT